MPLDPEALDTLSRIMREVDELNAVPDPKKLEQIGSRFEEWRVAWRVSARSPVVRESLRRFAELPAFISRKVVDPKMRLEATRELLRELASLLAHLLANSSPKPKCAPVRVFRPKLETRTDAKGNKIKVRVDPEDAMLDDLEQRGILPP